MDRPEEISVTPRSTAEWIAAIECVSSVPPHVEPPFA